MRESRAERLKEHLKAALYTPIITALEQQRPATAEEWRILGLAYLRSGRYLDAESPLTQASVLGDQEASVEYGNLLRVTGRLQQACNHFEKIVPALEGELKFRAERWWGVAQYQAGDLEGGLRRSERAWHGYMALGDDLATMRVTTTLATLCRLAGQIERAGALYREALRTLPDYPYPDARFTALQGLAGLYVEQGRTEAVEQLLPELRRLAELIGSPLQAAHARTVEIEALRLRGRSGEVVEALWEMFHQLEDLPDVLIRRWVTVRLADQLSLSGQHTKAYFVLYRYAKVDDQSVDPEVQAVTGMLMRRQGQAAQARDHLIQAVAALEAGQPLQAARARLHLADAYFQLAQVSEGYATLQHALVTLMSQQGSAVIKGDLDELGELVSRALLEPGLAPFMESLQEQLMQQPQPLTFTPMRQVEVRTFGIQGGELRIGGQNVVTMLSGTILTLAYLHLHPNITRADLQLALYPDKDGETGANYFRSVFRELRQILGPDCLVVSGPARTPHYRLNPELRISLDLTAFQVAIQQERLSRALALYTGPFLNGNDSPWVQEVQEECEVQLQVLLRLRIQDAEVTGDSARALLLWNRFIALFPHDVEALEARLKVAEKVAPATEVAQYQQVMRRALSN